VGVDNRDGAIVVRARTSTNRNNSNITLVFDAPSLELRQWTVKDNQGGTTTVALQQPQKDVALEDSLFAVPVKAPGRVKQSRN
jgi:outer membrane lipoprotein-sorting protein